MSSVLSEQSELTQVIRDQLNDLSIQVDRLIGRCRDLKLKNAALEEGQRSLVDKSKSSPEKNRHHRVKTTS